MTKDFSCGNIARNLCSSSYMYLDSFGSIIAAILPERIILAILRETNLHTKSSVPECIVTILLQYIARSPVFW